MQKIALNILFLILLCLSFSCGESSYRTSDCVGADELVIDSYKVKEGKFSLLELEGKEYAPLSADMLQEYPDVIQEKDILHVMAFDNSPSNTLSLLNSISEQIGFSIREGLLRLPNLQPILVQGLTLAEATQKIEQTYTSQFPQIQIFLNFKDRPHNKVELAGLVSIPEVIADGKLRLFETLSKARIGLQANLFKSYLIRQNQMVPVDFYKLLKEGDMSQNIVMKGGDKIYIANASDTSIMVLGEVGQEGIIEIPSGFMSLRQAIASAGGISYTGRRSYIQIIRGHLQHPKIYTVSWDHVIHLPSDSLLLIPGDIVYIAATPITEWNRFMTQLLPTLVNINLLSKRQKNIGVNLP